MSVDQHARFLDRLRKSSGGVAVVAEWLRSRGHVVEVPETQFAPHAGVNAEYADGGDLFIVDPDNGRRRLEIKHISAQFTCRDDWPFREVFVSNKASVDRAVDAVAAYITINLAMTHAAIVLRETRGNWYVVRRFSKNTGNVESFYAVATEHAIFAPLGG